MCFVWKFFILDSENPIIKQGSPMGFVAHRFEFQVMRSGNSCTHSEVSLLL